MTDLEQLPINSLTGVGEKRKKTLQKMGIKSIAHLLQYYPFRYEDYRLKDLNQAEDEEKVTVRGKITSAPTLRYFGKYKSRLALKLDVEGLLITVCWFNQAFLKDKLTIGQTVVISGKWERQRLQVTANRTWFNEQEIGVLEPVYSLPADLKMHTLRQWIIEGFQRYKEEIYEVLPQELITRYRLLPRAQAMYWLHFPRNLQEAQQARRRLIYEELFLYELRIIAKKNRQVAAGITHTFDQRAISKFIADLPFLLTKAQQRVVDEILLDMSSPTQMKRLLQGDVGSGKTIVAATVLYANYLCGYQGALMVPTEILADQHLMSLQTLLDSYGITVTSLTGSDTSKVRREKIAQIETGMADVIVGTHALFQDQVNYARLGLVVTDEQHRFGVRQRSLLREKGLAPDILFMTATPIPRTLAISLFGEMDVSIIDELPAGRLPIDTYWIKKDAWTRIVKFMAKEASIGHQVYVICPLIEESEKLDLQNAQDVYTELCEQLSPLKVGILHGKMLPKEKEDVMQDFVNNQVQILVSTTVVEVGVNVPNATIMVIYDADRFGLAQLHQLRGRVGRGSSKSTCVLVANPKSDNGVERMRVMTETLDGFEIAERDLALRGPGDFLGVKQSGLPQFKVADLSRDVNILEIARKDAQEFLERPDFIASDEYKLLIKQIDDEQSLIKSYD